MSSKSAHKDGWKTVQNKNKIKKKTKLAAIVLGLIIFVILLGNLVRFTQTLFSPWKIYPDIKKNYIWNGEFNLNLVVLNQLDVSVLSYNPREKKLIILQIPQNVLVEVPNGFGKWQLRSVYQLGETDKKGAGFLKGSVMALLGIPIDGFLDVADLKKAAGSEFLVGHLKENPIFFLSALPKIKTDLTLWELIRLNMAASSVRFDKVERLDLSKVLDLENLADGTPIYTADPVKVDNILAFFADPTVKEEHKSIAIFNATESLGLAQKASRIITNLGGNVIITSNASQKSDKSLILGEKSKTLKRINQIFNFDCSDCDNITPENKGIESRAQISIILGGDFRL